MSRTPRLAAVGTSLGLGAVLLLAGPASAHVTASPSEVTAGSYTAATLTVPHGCAGSATTKLTIQVPDALDDVNPEMVPGWDVVVDKAPLATPVTDGDGNPVTDRESQVTYTARPGNELPDGLRLTFTLGFKAPDEPGTLLFKTIQTCEQGETAWIEETPAGGEEPEHPSPQVQVVAASADGDVEAAAASTTPADDDSGSSNGLAVAGIVVGALGLLVGGIALARSGSKTPAS